MAKNPDVLIRPTKVKFIAKYNFDHRTMTVNVNLTT